MEKILLIQIESGGNLKMDTSSLKNIVVLKDLPSNIVEEAIVVLKENRKIQKLELIDKSKKQNKEQSQVTRAKAKRLYYKRSTDANIRLYI